VLRVAYDNVVLLALHTMISIVLCSSVFLYYLPVLSIHFLLFVSKFYVVAGLVLIHSEFICFMCIYSFYIMFLFSVHFMLTPFDGLCFILTRF